MERTERFFTAGVQFVEAVLFFSSFLPCFPAGTPIVTSRGAVPIEEIKAGDLVLSRDQHDVNADVGFKPVQEAHQRVSEIMTIVVDGREIRTTLEHRFYVRGRGWTEAGELRPGFDLSTSTGDWVPVQAIHRDGTQSVVYNMTVTDWHTYFVGAKDWTFNVWVHNNHKGAGNAPNKTHWDYITEWHDKRATELFGNRPGRKLKGREYDKLYKGRDIEYKSDNFARGPRSQESIDRMNGQITKDIENLESGRANPHWHFEHDPSVAPEMAPLLKRLEDAGISWTWGSSTPLFR